VVSRTGCRTSSVVGMVAWQPQGTSTRSEPPRVFSLRLQHFALRFPLRLGILLHRLLLFPIRLAGSARLRHRSGARLSRGCDREANTQRAQQDKGSKFFHNLGELRSCSDSTAEFLAGYTHQDVAQLLSSAVANRAPNRSPRPLRERSLREEIGRAPAKNSGQELPSPSPLCQ